VQQPTAQDRIVGQHGGLPRAGPRRMPPKQRSGNGKLPSRGRCHPGRATLVPSPVSRCRPAFSRALFQGTVSRRPPSSITGRTGPATRNSRKGPFLIHTISAVALAPEPTRDADHVGRPRRSARHAPVGLALQGRRMRSAISRRRSSEG
jgi:hypothetical protein